MKAIWKFELTSHVDKIEAPIEKFLTVQMQGSACCVWALVDTSKPVQTYLMYLLGTGWSLPDIDLNGYIGTVQADGYVWHCFWEYPPEVSPTAYATSAVDPIYRQVVQTPPPPLTT